MKAPVGLAGITRGSKQWLPPRLSGYEQLERAVDETGFYDTEGTIRAGDYRP